MKTARERSSTKHFINNYATEDEIYELQTLLDKRLQRINDEHRAQIFIDDKRLANVKAVIYRHSGPNASTEWRWGAYGELHTQSDVQSVAEIYPYTYRGQYYAVAMFDDSVCIGLPQYARFHTGVTVTPVDSMPWYYNKVYSRKDWPKARALLQTKYDFHEVIRVRYLINAFVEKVGNEYFYPISDWPMVTVDPDDPTKFELDVKTKTLMHTCAWDPAHDECGDPYQETPKEPIYLESTIEKSVWDKLTAD